MLRGKTAIITGAAVGIGRATAIQMLSYGANVVLADVGEETLAALQAELCDFGERCLFVKCDVSNEDEVKKTVALAKERFGKVDILVNNAGLWRCTTPFWETPTEDWNKFWSVNMMGTVYFTKAVIEDMMERRYGRVINVASVAGVYGNANMAHYSATKGAMISFTRALAKEVSDQGVTVNAVSPGSVSPSEISDIDHTQPSTLSFAGRTGSGRENADLICFLASDKAGYISGQNIQIDGCRKKQ